MYKLKIAFVDDYSDHILNDPILWAWSVLEKLGE